MGLGLANYLWAYILLGFCAGMVSGTLGLGSGTIFIPALVFLFAFPQKSAQGTALAVMVPMAFVGALRYWRDPTIEVNLSIVGWIVIGALGGVLIGTELCSRLPAPALRKIFAIFLLIVAFRMLISPSKAGKPVHDKTVFGTRQDASMLVEKGSVKDDTGQ